MNNSYIYIYHVNVTQTVPDISPLMPMHQDPLLVSLFGGVNLASILAKTVVCWIINYRKISNIRCIESQNINDIIMTYDILMKMLMSVFFPFQVQTPPIWTKTPLRRHVWWNKATLPSSIASTRMPYLQNGTSAINDFRIPPATSKWTLNPQIFLFLSHM